MAFNEDCRVKIPAILHLTRLGFSYLSLKNSKRDEATNIFPEIFHASHRRINPDSSPDDTHHLPLTAEGCQFISNLVLNEYLAEFHGQQPA